MPDQPRPRLISIEDAADMLGVTRRTVERMAGEKLLTLIDVGFRRGRRTWRIDEHEVIALIQRRTVGSA